MCQSPAEVLLNFDLDICAMGYDGEQFYMLPRAARALETGYNVFTMDLVQGHYLGTRRASQEQRVFKYAKKGYGIRILPSYLAALKTVDVEELPHRRYHHHEPETLDIEKQVEKAKDYFDRVFRTYLAWSSGGEMLQRTYVGSYSRVFKGTSQDIRTREQKNKNVPIFTHALFDTVAQLSKEPLARSCLTGFELFYRHVGLFEAEAAGKCVIEPNVWASTTYEEVHFSSTYNDLPNYVWDETFRIKEFAKELDRFNHIQSRRSEYGWGVYDGDGPKVGKPLVRRIIHGTTVEEVLEKDVRMMVWMPEDFVVFVREMVAQVVKERNIELLGDFISESWRLPRNTNLVLYEVKIDTVIMWQQVDRRLDDNDLVKMTEEARFRLLRLQISRRALRSKAENEFLDFALWVARDPGEISGGLYGPMGRGFWPAAFDEDRAIEEEEEDSDEYGEPRRVIIYGGDIDFGWGYEDSDDSYEELY
ncbi:hypothetical protein FRB91_009285 [Serendipita sp. 411]|nr:hypothetical protein FRB91_009285 [Serendipita sp. 411]